MSASIDPQVLKSIVYRCWRNGLGLGQTAEAIKRDTGHKVDRDTIQRLFARFASQ